MAQVQAEHFQPVAPVLEVRFGGVTRRGVAREAGGDDQRRTGTQQFESGLVADLDATAGEQRHAPAQVGGLGALEEVQVRAGRAQLVVEVVDARVLLLADIAMQQFRRLVVGNRIGRVVARIVQAGCLRREIVRRGEHRLAAQGADAGLVEQRLGRACLFLRTFAGEVLRLAAARARFRMVHQRHRLQQAFAIRRRPCLHDVAVGDDGVEQGQRGLQAVVRRRVVVGDGRCGVGIRCRGGVQGQVRVARRRGDGKRMTRGARRSMPGGRAGCGA